MRVLRSLHDRSHRYTETLQNKHLLRPQISAKQRVYYRLLSPPERYFYVLFQSAADANSRLVAEKYSSGYKCHITKPNAVI
jgi:hypothetical protein